MYPQLKRLSVTKGFQAWILEYFHPIQPGSPAWRFLSYLLLVLNQGKRTRDGLVIPSPVLACLEGKKYNSNYKAEVFLKKMKIRFPELEIGWSSWLSTERRARVLYYQLPKAVTSRLQQECSELAPESERVFFVNGDAINRHNKARLCQEALAAAKELNKQNHHLATADAMLIEGYLNSLPSNHFTRMLSKHLETAKHQALNTPNKQRELNILESISLQPQPFYTISIKSPRLAIRGGLGELKTSIRKTLTADWTDLDLKNVQLAINASLWNLPEVQTFLSKGVSWWEELFEWFGVSSNQELKRRFKGATYSLCYGASKKTIKNGDEWSEGLGGYTNRFFQHPIVKELWQGRKEQLKQITCAGGAIDAYGQWIAVLNSDDLYGFKVNSRSVLAQVAQSYEQVLIAEVFKLSIESQKAFTVCLYQSDGVSVVFKDTKRKELWLNRIYARVEAKAEKLGIITKIVW